MSGFLLCIWARHFVQWPTFGVKLFDGSSILVSWSKRPAILADPKLFPVQYMLRLVR